MSNFIILADSFRNPVIGPTIRHTLGRLPSCCSGIYYPLSPGFCGLNARFQPSRERGLKRDEGRVSGLGL